MLAGHILLLNPLFSFLSHFPFLLLLSLPFCISRFRTSGDPLSRMSSRVRSCIPLTPPFNLIRRADLQLKFLSDVFPSRHNGNHTISKPCRRGKIDKGKFYYALCNMSNIFCSFIVICFFERGRKKKKKRE